MIFEKSAPEKQKKLVELFPGVKFKVTTTGDKRVIELPEGLELATKTAIKAKLESEGFKQK